MPDLGKYALEVTLAYGGSFVLIAALVALTVAQSRRTRKTLDEMEKEAGNG